MKTNLFAFPQDLIALAVAAVLLLSTTDAVFAGAGWGSSTNITGAPILTPTYYANSPIGFRPDPLGGASVNTGTPLRKFVDTLPGLGAAGANNLGQYIPVAVPEKWVDGNGNVTNDDYYEIAVVEYSEKMHSDLIKPTRLRGYVQLSTAKTPGKRIPLTYPGGAPILDTRGAQVFAVDNPHYLGPLISATRGTAVRIKYTNYLPVGAAGALFLPVDKTLPGAGHGPDGVTMFTENRADIHLHGGDTPWISDGTPHQWIAPAGETAAYAAIDPNTGLSMGKGASAQNVPDMPDPGPGSNTLYFPNEMSGRFMFYHDHTSGLTRLNVYGGIAAGYLLSDPVEQGLVKSGVIPATQIPLMIQDKTFVPKDIAQQDAKWDTLHWGQEGDLWFPHVYETNQDPNSFDGTNPVGRWDWGPWFWPVFPAQFSLPSGSYGDVSTTPEAFMDTPVINGTAYPTLTVDPKAYRFRVLNAANDRFFNLSLFVADPTIPARDPVTGQPNPAFGKEVKMVPAIPNAAFPPTWPADGRAGGAPDPALAGPDIIQIGSEGGILPHPAVLPAQPVTYEQNRRSITVLNILDTGLYLGPAERADVIIDFSGFAGKTLILYNDAPAPVPAFDPRVDYYSGDGDHTGGGGAYNTLPGYGPNTRTIMQIKVSATPPAAPFNVAALNAALPVAYGQSQNRPVVPESAYNAAFGTNDADNYAKIATGTNYSPIFSWTPTAAGQVVTSVILTGGGTTYASPPQVVFNGGVDLSPAGIAAGNAAATAVAVVDPVTRKVSGIQLISGGAGYTSAPLITFTGGGGMGATAVVQTSLTRSLPIYNKAIQELFEPVYGRMNATLGIEMPLTNFAIQTTVPLNYIDPVTETIAAGETQIWKITHNGVDTHPVHFHKVNVQLINRIGWDGTVKPPSAGELGWKETVKMNPLEDVVVAVRAKRESVPFGVPQSVRPMDPSRPLGSVLGFTQVDLIGNPTASPGAPDYNPNYGRTVPVGTVSNMLVNFDNEYVWHCHILGHEENDFMRAVVFHPNDVLPDAPRNVNAVGGGVLTWSDPTPTMAPAVDAFGVATLGNPKNEIGFKVLRASNGGTFAQVGTALANATSWTDTAWTAAGGYAYQVIGYNAAGDSLPSNTATTTIGLSPATLTFASQQVGTSSGPQTVTLSNYGTVPIALTSISVTGANAADFVQTNNCGTSLGVGAAGSCTITVTFTAHAAGARTATLTVTDTVGTQTAMLKGTGAVTSATLTPAAGLTFAVQQTGTPGTAQALRLTNTGVGPLSITSVTIGGANATDFTQTNNCGAALAAGAAGTCTINVTFLPSAAGARAATLSVVDAAGTQTIVLAGTGALPSATLTPVAGLTFAVQQTGTPSAAQTLTLTNTGFGPLSITGVAIGGVKAADYTQTNNCGAVLVAGAAGTCTVNVTFMPSAAGASAATLTVTDAAGVQTIALSGAGAVPASTLTPTAPISFANQQVGGSSIPQSLTLTNTGVVPVRISSIAIGGANYLDFAQNNSCGASVAAGASCAITVSFAPKTIGTKVGTLTVVDAAGIHTVALGGTAVATPTAALMPGSVAFGTYPVAATPTAPQSVVLTNTSAAPLSISSIMIGGMNFLNFAQTNNCGTSLAAGKSCTINVTFTPNWPGAKTANLTVTSAAGTQTVNLTGTAAQPKVSLTPAMLAFGNHAANTTSAAQSVTLTNTGVIPIAINSIGVSAGFIVGVGQPDFAQTNNCGMTLAAGASCTINVTFAPTTAGFKSGMLTVIDQAGTQIIFVSGVAQ